MWNLLSDTSHIQPLTRHPSWKALDLLRKQLWVWTHKIWWKNVFLGNLKMNFQLGS